MTSMTNKQQEILDILQEECAEVIQAVSKIRRFGAKDNMETLCKEMADVLTMIDLCKQYIPFIQDYDMSWPMHNKLKKLEVYSNIFKDEPLQGNNH